MVLTKILGARKAKEIRLRINFRQDLWERCIHAGLVGGELAEGRSRKGRLNRGKGKEKDRLARNFHSNFLSGKLWQAVYRATNREGGGVFSWGVFA